MIFSLEEPGGGLLRIGDLEDPSVAKEIGSGGAGRVLRPQARTFRGQLIKLYHTDPQDYAARHEQRVRALIAAAPPGLRCHGEAVELAWPQAAVRDSTGKFRGFVMQEIGEFRLDQVLHPPLRRKCRITEAMYFRLTLAHSLAVLVDKLHQAGYRIIDLKPENLRVSRSGPFGRVGEVGLIDADGLAFQAPDGTRYAPGFATDEYLYPRIIELERDAWRYALEQDRWALAVIVFQLLNDNIHPLSGIDDSALRAVHPAAMIERARFQPSLYAYGQQPHPRVQPAPGSLHGAFCTELRELADQAFSARLEPPEPARWIGVLERLAGPNHRCPRKKHHWLHGDTCGACALEGRLTMKKAARPARPNGPRGTSAAPMPSRGHTTARAPGIAAVNAIATQPAAPLWPWLITALIVGGVIYGLSWVDPEQIGLPTPSGHGATTPQPSSPALAVQPATGASMHSTPVQAVVVLGGSGLASGQARSRAGSTPTVALGKGRSLAQLTSTEVRRVQSTLARLGYAPGPVDGISGPRTRAAIRAFTQDRQLQSREQSLALLVQLSSP